MNNGSHTFRNTLLLGIAIGTVLGLVIAPWEGKKTRRKIANRSRELKSFLSGKQELSEWKENPDITIMVVEPANQIV
ncbi:MAG: YtxH domain-containing protein [Saprospiraceae bacterium]|nr:YtxH domain-containing protein [Saprospiraceae bacterium]